MRRRHSGFTYIGLLLVIAIIGLVLVKVSEVWVFAARRDKEEQLLWVGDQYRHALARYYMAGGGERYPHQLEDLLKDPRTPNTRRFLRQLYPDPMTGKAEWGLVKVGDLITGIYSLSETEPIKKADFAQDQQSFADAQKYSDWVFVPKIGRGLPGLNPGALPVNGQPPATGQPGNGQPGNGQQPGTVRQLGNGQFGSSPGSGFPNSPSAPFGSLMGR